MLKEWLVEIRVKDWIHVPEGQRLGPASACKKGCSHCCHIPVAVSDLEASVIGKRIWMRPHTPSYAQAPSERAYGYNHPCPFLTAGVCSIYAHRPFACRVHFNMDRDDLLCRLLPDMLVPVPYADMRQLQQAYVMLEPNARLADVREFFPTGLKR